MAATIMKVRHAGFSWCIHRKKHQERPLAWLSASPRVHLLPVAQQDVGTPTGRRANPSVGASYCAPPSRCRGDSNTLFPLHLHLHLHLHQASPPLPTPKNKSPIENLFFHNWKPGGEGRGHRRSPPERCPRNIFPLLLTVGGPH
ncbi:unnamed protein product [Hapterophycus canaliculatus]